MQNQLLKRLADHFCPVIEEGLDEADVLETSLEEQAIEEEREKARKSGYRFTRSDLF